MIDIHSGSGLGRSVAVDVEAGHLVAWPLTRDTSGRTQGCWGRWHWLLLGGGLRRNNELVRKQCISMGFNGVNSTTTSSATKHSNVLVVVPAATTSSATKLSTSPATELGQTSFECYSVNCKSTTIAVVPLQGAGSLTKVPTTN
ncbi:hypothetical protein THAOC_36009 [Thalassiosira oceanica]|uniref:Uncharacterized protein n=1 Tax=Thalassiosira oceanica TaxID=159749 RepID=K0R2G6_THAOC|nr:hypothetical protein THAOC_36009 [Thalassiosira oceanica]|eukprot:EJK45379.1 hypothetical protein THAOC_36009 [Thalassiosira oceanica]